jgi:predicted P-loop ATPase
MSREDFERVGSVALQSVESLVAEWLPMGKREGIEWCVGSRDGEPGRSMKICISGAKAGVWSDFADDKAGGDLISLYAYISRMEQVDAMKAIASQLGINVGQSFSARGRTAPAQAVRRVEVPAVTPKKPRTAWVPMLPVPDDAPVHPAAHLMRGKPAMSWKYMDQQGRLLGVVYRFVTSDGGKEVLPCVFAEHPVTGAREWRWMGFPELRPLYLTAPLRDDVLVVVVEGEKCADAGYAALACKLDVVSWPGGSKAVAKIDWSPLAGRKVLLWADADAPGAKAMDQLAEILLAQGCAVKTVVNPEGVAAGWDVADAVAEGIDIRELLAAAIPAGAESISTPSMAGAPPLVLPGDDEIDTAWQQSLIRKPSNNRLEDCRENVLIIMMHDPDLKGVVAQNEFSMMQVKRRIPPWGGDLGEWTEADDFQLGMFLAQRHGLVIKSDGAIEKAVAQAARESKYNPVTGYLRGLEWDGEQRLHTWLTDAMGVEPSKYSALIGTLFIMSLVARAFRPGCQMDYAPVFEGGQGAGKSSAMRVLGGDWYSETPFKMGDKDGYMAIQGVWLYEIAELDSFNRSETTAVKAFITNMVDRFRAPYGRRMLNVERRTCFCATTNQDEYFKDTTGNRRFWPLRCGYINLALLAEMRDQLFAEAVNMVDGGAKWYPTREEQRELIEPQQEMRELEDVWTPRIYRFVEGVAETEDRTPLQRLNEVTAETLLTKALHIEIGKISSAKQETMRISVCMKRMGWEKKRRPSGAREWYYARPVDVDEVDEELPL